ncbi:acyltransferase family protein [Mumia sp. zg.B53]|uniref:acyltransferase family protein n=1 Tax=Mumia sp. zg.B53 TaxID=2855449 RepID=UPI001C6E1B53|nr:acyltransferase family protein [Mumia sp. zg.B53]MBW9214101.1 acyltransferase family protein [Mumia sp. zg.B53]
MSHSSHVSSPSTASGATRDPYLDNVKGALIVLVVVGHGVGQVLAAPGAWDVYFTIYLFHMPAFVLLCGMLTARTLVGRRASSLIRSLVIPYVVFQLLYLVSFRALGDDTVEYSANQLLTPLYQLWFLLSLLAWRLMAPMFAQLRPSVAIGTSLVISVLGGAASDLGLLLSLNRTFGMLPFFVIGLCLGRGAPNRVPPRAGKVAGAVVLAVVLVPLGMFARDQGMIGWLAYIAPYSAFDMAVGEATLTRLVVIGAGLSLTAAFVAVLPRRATPVLTAVGAASMYPFLLHGLVLRVFAASPLDERLESPLGLAIVVGGCVLMTVVLASRPVRSCLRPFVEPRCDWLFRRGDGRAEPSQAVRAEGPRPLETTVIQRDSDDARSGFSGRPHRPRRLR